MQVTLQSLMSPMKSNLCRRYRDVEGRADFRMRPPVYVLHYHDRSQARWKLAEGASETVSEFQLLDPALGLRVAAILGLNDIRQSCLLMTSMSPPTA